MFHNSQTIQGSFQRRHPANRAVALLAVLALFACADWAVVARAEDRSQVSGEILRIDGLRVLRVWGAPRERGFAHGYLLAGDIIKLLDGYLGEAEVTGGVEAYRANLPRLPKLFVLEPPYEAELRGMAEGIAARLGDRAVVPILGRKIGYEDVLAINCIPDSARMGCSSFAAWGTMTANGETISGRNLDWHRIAALRGTEIVIANTPCGPAEWAAWASVTWPGFIGCLTGMNDRGVTLAMHDVRALPASQRGGFTPRGLILREAIEAARSSGFSPEPEIAAVLRRRRCAVGNNVPVSFPCPDSEAASVVFEYDGATSPDQCLTCVQPRSIFGTERQFQVATNHYRRRGVAIPCRRHDIMKSWLAGRREDRGRVDLDEAWRILRSVACRGADSPLETYHSVVFEPNKRLLHVAFSAEGKPAADCKPVTLDLARLLSPPAEHRQPAQPAARPLAAQPAGR